MLAKKIATARHRNEPEPFKKIEFPSLTDYALEIVTKSYFRYPELTGLKQPYRDQVISKINTNQPIKITTPNISNESFWQRSCENRWKNVKIEHHGNSWKQAYLERHLEELIQTFKTPEDFYNNASEFYVARSYIFNLRINGLLCSFDFKVLFDLLPLLNNLNVTFGAIHAGMEYKRQSFGMKMNDAAGLAEGIKISENLISLSLPGNMIDDDLMKILMSGLQYNRTLIDLNLMHNKISNQGARRIAKFIFKNDILINLDLSDNQIGYDGSRFLSQAIKTNKTLQRVNLKLNNFRDKGGAKFFRDMMENTSLIYLNLSANGLGKQTAEKISEYLTDKNCTLQTLEINSNEFGDNCLNEFRNSFKANLSLKSVDLRQNQFKGDNEKQLTEIILKKYLDAKKIPLVNDVDFDSRIKKIENRHKKPDKKLDDSNPLLRKKSENM